MRKRRKRQGLALNTAGVTVIVPASTEPTTITVSRSPGQLVVQSATRLELRETGKSLGVSGESEGGGEKSGK